MKVRMNIHPLRPTAHLEGGYEVVVRDCLFVGCEVIGVNLVYGHKITDKQPIFAIDKGIAE